MNYTFPHINTIQDVLPHIKDNPAFIVLDKGDYTIIDYVLQDAHTFEALDDITKKIKRECRGLIFNKEGKLISRPLHKFFNYGEKPEEQEGMGLPEHMLEKLDGSMIRPLIIDGNIRLATRKGITDVAMQAEAWAAGKENYILFISAMDSKGLTPIFEWCSSKNQIVIEYPEDNLILLALREINSGKYISYEDTINYANTFNIPVVKSHPVEGDLKSTIEFIKTIQDKEGFVFLYNDGHKVKAKADWYVTLHRAKEAIGREKDLIKAYLTTGVDDILPILPEKDRQEVASFLAKLTENVYEQSQRLDGMFTNVISPLPENFTRKQFALRVLNLDSKYKSIMFNLLDGTPCMEVVIAYLIKACCNNKTLDQWRWLIGGIKFGDKLEEEAA